MKSDNKPQTNLRSKYAKIPEMSSDTKTLGIRALFILGVAILAVALYGKRESHEVAGGKSQ